MKPESLDWDFHGILSPILILEDHPFAGTQFADNICAVSSKCLTSVPSGKVMAYKAKSASIMLAKLWGLVQGLTHFRSMVDADTVANIVCQLVPKKTDEKGLNEKGLNEMFLWNWEMRWRLFCIFYILSLFGHVSPAHFQYSTWVEITTIS